MGRPDSAGKRSMRRLAYRTFKSLNPIVLGTKEVGPRRLLLAASASALAALLFRPLATANARHLLGPSINHGSGHVALPRRQSATLSIPVMHWLQRQGISYVIPYVPRGFPPVKALAAARAAVMHTPVGPNPTIRELALISPLTAIPPLVAHSIVWAVVLSSAGSPGDKFYVTFVEVRTPRVVGSLLHPHSAAKRIQRRTQQAPSRRGSPEERALRSLFGYQSQKVIAAMVSIAR